MRDSPSSTSAPLSEYFKTVSSALAAAIIASGSLSYSHAELHTNNRDVIFIFKDPCAQGEEIQRRYTACTLPMVHAKTLAEARGFLVDEITRIKQGGGYGKR